MNLKLIEEGVKLILQGIGENVNREGILDTPRRVSKMYQEFFSGIAKNETEPLKKIFNEPYGDLVMVKNIHFVSFCEHHLLPFIGNVSLGYIPNGKVVGLSKLSRMIDIVAARPQLQEKLTREISEALEVGLKPKGIAVVVSSTHSCMAHRGTKKESAKMITQSFKGCLNTPEEKQYFYQLL